MPQTIPQAVRELCLAFPQSEERTSHGMPDFKVAGKSFAYFTINHHGDGRVGLWLKAPEGAQQQFVSLDPDVYFVPQYVGPRGWLGIELNSDVSWDEVRARVREAWETAAPKSLAAQLDKTPATRPPTRKMKPEEIDPWLGQRAGQLLSELRKRCEGFPEVTEHRSFGAPVWKAGKKTFACAHTGSGRIKLQTWVGVEQQAMLTDDPRYTIPMYVGNKGWIDLDIEDHVDWNEVDGLLDISYRHFALKRMLAALDKA
ncbi:MAG: MmcQ/YjbR family DNA-binding protein [Xanthomonadales bacterium]|nr:MmcQ/YjbR family DNA-binding protein [Xanthomonadales bacterium]